MEIKFRLSDRINVHTKNGVEWALDVNIDEDGFWTIYTWDNKPTMRQYESVKDIVFRSFEVYHSAMRNNLIPRFSMNVYDL